MRKIRFKAAIQLWIDDAKERGLSPRTVQWYQYELERFRKWSESEEVPDRAGVRQYIIWLRESGKRNQFSVNSTIRALRTFYNFLVKQELLDEPVKLRLSREPKQPVPRIPEEDVKAMLAQPNPKSLWGLRDLAIMYTLLDTGIRNNALCRLTVGDFQDGMLTVHEKGNKTHRVPVGAETRKVILRYLARRGGEEDEPLFLSKAGGHLTPNGLAQIMRRYARKAGVKKANPHRWRHTFASAAADQGASMLWLKEMLGHDTLEMVQRYVHMSDQELANLHSQYSPVAKLREKRARPKQG